MLFGQRASSGQFKSKVEKNFKKLSRFYGSVICHIEDLNNLARRIMFEDSGEKIKNLM